MIKKTKAIANNFIESCTTCQNLTDFLLVTAADTSPPAIAPMKYAPISNDP